MRPKPIFLLIVSLLPCLLASSSPCRGAPPPDPVYDDAIDSPMYQMPKLPFPPVLLIFPEKARELWLRALERPEADLRGQAADAVALACRRGYRKEMQSTIDPLLTALDRADEQPIVRVSIAKALIALEARQAADQLWRQSQVGDSDLREAVEPVLARWKYKPAQEVWLARLRESATPPRSLVLAIRGLAALQDSSVVDRLRDMARSAQLPGPLRLESARALAELRSQGLEKDAELLLADRSTRGLVARLVAVSMLRRHGGPDSIRLLQSLLRDKEPAVAAVASDRLLEIDPALLLPSIQELLAHADPHLRAAAVEALYRRPDRERLRWLRDRLDDANRNVRLLARRHLRELAADKKWHSPIIADAMAMLNGESWRGLEQAAILLAQLDHKPAVERLMQLVSFPRWEVSLASAWGVRKMDVPQMLPVVVHYLESELKRLRADRDKAPSSSWEPAPRPIVDFVLSQLNQFVGQRKYRPAEAILRQFIPKGMQSVIHGSESRAAAIWALGMIREGNNDPALAAALDARLADTMSMPPEDNRVRRMAALTLGRMKAEKQLTRLRDFYTEKKPALDAVNNACGWAIERITGEVMPKAEPIRRMQRDWFLSPDK